ncbi:MAG: hypothetical protein IK144_04975 [Bacteroidaceae bacterium]|nr:hypothetical protein [Bacteroidaceae bacterium]
MEKAFLYDSLCGIVYRCMYAGIDDNGHAQWVNITPGEETEMLENIPAGLDLDDTRLCMLAMDGELAQSRMVAKVLAKVLMCPVGEVGADMAYCMRRMQQNGLVWDHKPLELGVKVFENTPGGRRKGKYTFWLGDNFSDCSIYIQVDGFDNLTDIFRMIRLYFITLETAADINITKKYLCISSELKKQVGRMDLRMFDYIESIDN